MYYKIFVLSPEKLEKDWLDYYFKKLLIQKSNFFLIKKSICQKMLNLLKTEKKKQHPIKKKLRIKAYVVENILQKERTKLSIRPSISIIQSSDSQEHLTVVNVRSVLLLSSLLKTRNMFFFLLIKQEVIIQSKKEMATPERTVACGISLEMM